MALPARRAAGPDLPPALVAVPVEARPLRRFRQPTRCWRAARFPPRRPRVAVLSPYFPYPLSHGGAVRIFNLLREAARRFDIFLFAFTEARRAHRAGPGARVLREGDPGAQAALPRAALVQPARRPKSTSTARPSCARLLDEMRRQHSLELLQVEYTQLASYGGDVLVEHDVTYDLYRQVHAEQTLALLLVGPVRWRRFETQALGRYRRVVAMSAKDAGLLGVPHARGDSQWRRSGALPSRAGTPRPAPAVHRLLPPLPQRRSPTGSSPRRSGRSLRDEFPDMTLTVVAGPDPLTYWRAAADSPAPAPDDAHPAARVRRATCARSTRRPTWCWCRRSVSAGTNVKVLEAMAMERAVVSTSSRLRRARASSTEPASGSPTIAQSFAEGVRRLISDEALRHEHRPRRAPPRRAALRLEATGRRAARAVGGVAGHRGAGARGHAGRPARTSPPSRLPRPRPSAWAPEDYLAGGCLVAVGEERVAGFLAFRQAGEGECEILNLAVAPEARRQGLATALVEEVDRSASGDAVPGSAVLQRRCPQPLPKAGFRRGGATA